MMRRNKDRKKKKGAEKSEETIDQEVQLNLSLER